jgi:hypothetical protein
MARWFCHSHFMARLLIPRHLKYKNILILSTKSDSNGTNLKRIQP